MKKKYSRAQRLLVVVAPFVQILIVLILIHQADHFMGYGIVFHLALGIALIALLLLLVVFFKEAKKNEKIVLLVFSPFIPIFFLWYNGTLDRTLFEDIVHVLKRQDHFEIMVSKGYYTIDYHVFIGLEKSISPISYVDHVFIVGLNELLVPTINIKTSENICKVRGIAPENPIEYIDTIMPLSERVSKDKTTLDTIHYKAIPISELIYYSYSLEDYKPNLIKPISKDEILEKNQVKFLAYCFPRWQTSIKQQFRKRSYFFENKFAVDITTE